LSGLVETEYGYHIIQVMDKQTAHVQSFDEVKPQLLAEAQKDAGAAGLKKAINDARAEIVRNPSQAVDIAKKYNLKFFKLDKFSRTDAMPEVNTQPEVYNAIFTTPKGTVSNVTDLDSIGKSAFGIVNNIYPSHNAEYAEVEKDVLQRYTDAESLRLSQEAAKTAAARAKKGESLEALAKEYGISVKTAAPFPVDGAAEGIGAGSYLTAAFKANVGDVVGPVAAGSGQFVCKVSEKIPADLAQFAKEKDALIQQMNEQKRSLQQSLFRASVVADLKKRGKVKLNQDLIGRMVSSNLS
jgi:peptidyl-prolyl cis-trans isomerase D